MNNSAQEETTREQRFQQLLEDCRNVRSVLLTTAERVDVRKDGSVKMKATNIASALLPSPRHTSFVMACIKAMGIARYIEKVGKDHWWKVDGKVDVTRDRLEDILKIGEVFTSRGQANDPYDLQQVEVIRAKTPEEQIAEPEVDKEQLEKLLAEAQATISSREAALRNTRTLLAAAQKVIAEELGDS